MEENNLKKISGLNQLRNTLKAIVFFLLPPVKRLRRELDELQKEFEDLLKEMHSEYNLHEILGATNYILGETKPIRPSHLLKWYKSVSESINTQLNQEIFSKLEITTNNLLCEKKDKYTLSIITSLYKGGKYIHPFLENITQQSVFSDCELIIVDANSPENESVIIEKYIPFFPNIRYIKLEERIGIYDAWNLAIQESNSDFITNANLDDLHRNDAFEIKINALKSNLEIDIVYSDVYYSFIENLSFDVIAKGNLKTNFTSEVTKFNLLQYNYPHNSPMWRRTLHDKIGYFDTQYKSAGDHEFWLRAAFEGCSFKKIDEVVTVYYNNPVGISTNIQSAGALEGPKIVKIYQDKLNSLELS
jgi:hypothetical protein